MTSPLKRPIVIKIGGSTLGTEKTILEDLVTLQKSGTPLIVVHGGGQIISEWQKKLGIATQFVSGLRVTDIATLEVVVSVLAGLVNKQLVGVIKALGGKVIGLSGVDDGLIEAKIENKELGYTGEVANINVEPLMMFLKQGYIPLIAPVSLRTDYRKIEGNDVILNVNGDTAAAAIGAAINAERVIFLTDVIGLCDKSGKLIPSITSGEVPSLITSGAISGGMIPKIKACLRAVSNNTTIARIIDGRNPHSLLSEIKMGNSGTTVSP